MCTSLVHCADTVTVYVSLLQALPQRRCLVSRPNSPWGPNRNVVMQPVRYQEGDGEAAADSSENRVIVITSGKGGVGKTTTSANLGMSIARWDREPLVAEWKRYVHKCTVFEKENGTGNSLRESSKEQTYCLLAVCSKHCSVAIDPYQLI